MADRATPDQQNTIDFAVVEQNSDRVNIEDISMSPSVATAFVDLSKDDGLKKLQAFISAGKKLSEAISKARSAGKIFIRAMDLVINIQTEPDQITHNDLTKQRTMALCHRVLLQSGKCANFNSPLVGRVNFNQDNPLTPIRPLLGAGFQFLGQTVISIFDKEDYRSGVLLFHLGCMVLDYIRKTSPSMDAQSSIARRPLVDPNKVDFMTYVFDGHAGEGEVFIAGCRNLDQSALTVLEDESESYTDMVRKVSVGRFGGSVGDRIAKNFNAIAYEMRRALNSDRSRLRAYVQLG